MPSQPVQWRNLEDTPSGKCGACRGDLETELHSLVISPTWERHTHRLHMSCWRELMIAAAVGMEMRDAVASAATGAVIPTSYSGT